MVFYVVLRGPLGVGKTTVAERSASDVGAAHISIDRILEERDLERWYGGYISQGSFLRANAFAADRARKFLERGTPVIFDGNFYWRSQVEDLLGRLDYPHYGFTLKAPFEVCIERDSRRAPPHGREAAREVYEKSTEFDWGIGLDAAYSVETLVREITLYLHEGSYRSLKRLDSDRSNSARP
jgi:predicted kinase